MTIEWGHSVGVTPTIVRNLAQPFRVEVSPSSAALDVDQTQRFTAIGYYADGSHADVTSLGRWTSSNASARKLSAGLFIAEIGGDAAIMFSLGLAQASAALSVEDHVCVTLVSIAVTPSSSTVNIGAQQQLVAIGTYSDSSTLNLTSAVEWTSSDGTKASITNGTNGGLVSGLSNGDVTMTASLLGVNGTASIDVPANFAARTMLSMAIQSNSDVPASTFLMPVYVPPGVTTATVSLSNQNSAFGDGSPHGPEIDSVDVAIYASDGSGNPTGPALFKWLAQTIPDGGVAWTSPSFDASTAIGSDGQFVVAYATPASATVLTATDIRAGSYVQGTASVDPLPGGFAVNPSAALSVWANFETGAPRIVVDGDSLSQAYSVGTDVPRTESAFYLIGPQNGWCVDDCGISGSTLAQWNDGTSRPFYRNGQILSAAIGLTNLSINDLPGLANLGAYQTLVAARIADWQANSIAHIVWGTLTPSDAYSADDTLRQAINAWLLTQEGVGGIDKVVDLDSVLRNPSNHAQLNPSYDTGDGTHWNVAGHAAAAAAISAKILTLI